MAEAVLGWDIGGAHVKAALLAADGAVLGVWQRPCPLWQGMDHLRNAISQILAEIPGQTNSHALTMTGELVDLFASRAEGVQAIIALAAQQFGHARLKVFAGKLGFLNGTPDSPDALAAIASANWYATAAYAARNTPSALLLDIGSTTTDILWLDNGAVQAVGMTDVERLASGELLYSGVVRTPVMAVTRHAPYQGHWVGLMAEHFATMADAYRLTGELHPDHDQAATADGAAKTELASARRLARMLGCDCEPPDIPQWRRLAQYLSECQLWQIQQACHRQLSRCGNAQELLVGAGVGRFLVQRLAQRLGYAYLDIATVFPAVQTKSSFDSGDCAAAVAVAALAQAEPKYSGS